MSNSRGVAVRQYAQAVGNTASQVVNNPAVQRAIGNIVKTALGKAVASAKKAYKKKAKEPSVSFRESNGSGQKRKLTSKKSKSKKKRSKGSIKKRVAKLEKKVGQNYAHHTFKIDEKMQVSCLTNTCAYQNAHIMNGTSFLTFLDSIPWTDESSPSVEKSFNMGVVAQPLNITIKAVASATFRNNYLYPACLKLYVLRPRGNNSDAPETDVQNGITELSNPSVENWAQHNMYPSDSKRFLQKWKILKTQEIRLQSGDEVTISHKESFNFDHKDYAEIGTVYQKKYSRVLFARICGVVAHESATPANIGTAPAKVDCVISYVYKLDRPADVPIKALRQDGVLNDLTTPIVGVASAEVENAIS